MEAVKEVVPENNTDEAISLEIKMETFSLQSVFDLQNKFDAEKWALKTLYQLLGSSTMEIFVDDYHESDNYRWGLQQLFELCVDRQEERIKALRDMALNSPEYIIERARKLPDEIDRGWHAPPCNHKDIQEILKELEVVLDLFGPERYPEAEIIKKQILSRILREQEPGNNSLSASNGTDG